LCQETEDYVQGLTLAREALVSLRCVQNDDSPKLNRNREKAEDMLNEKHAEKAPSEQREVWEPVRDLRNRVAHPQNDQLPARTLAEKANEALADATHHIRTAL
jgi:hypothetical protein